MLDEAGAELGGLDGIVLNIGIAGGLGLQGTSVEDWDRVMAVNARGHFLGLKHGIPALADGGSVVLTGSLASRETMPSPPARSTRRSAGSPRDSRRSARRSISRSGARAPLGRSHTLRSSS